jgi:membrane-bound ClpP family serine protease
MNIDVFVGGPDGLVLIGMGFLALEFFLPTKGFLALCGLIFFLSGTYLLTEHPNPELRLGFRTMLVINGVVLTLCGGILYVMYRGYFAPDHLRPNLVGQTGRIIEWQAGHGRIAIDGVIWNAASDATFTIGDAARVVSLDGLVLYLEKMGET